MSRLTNDELTRAIQYADDRCRNHGTGTAPYPLWVEQLKLLMVEQHKRATEAPSFFPSSNNQEKA